LKVLGVEPESVELGRLYLSMGGMYFQTGYMTEALSWTEKALELAKKLEKFRIMARSYSVLAAVFSGKGDTRKACECAEKALKISLDNNYAENAISAYNNLAAALPVEQSERRLECLEKAYELAKKAGIIGSISWQGSNLASIYALMGDTEKALRLAEESVALDRKANDLLNLSMSMIALGFAYYMLGEWDTSEQSYKEALINAEKAHSYQAAAYGNGALGALYFDKGEYAKARECFDKMYQVLEKAGAKPIPIIYVYFAFSDALTYIALGEMEKAKTLVDKMQELAVQAKDKGLIASADLLRAIQFRAERNWPESLKFFERGLQELETIDAKRWSLAWFAGMLCEYAQVYLERDEEGDREKAHKILNQALEMFQKIGAKKEIEKILAKKRLLTA